MVVSCGPNSTRLELISKIVIVEKRSRNNPMIDRAESLGMLLAELYYLPHRDYETDLTNRLIRVIQFISDHN